MNVLSLFDGISCARVALEQSEVEEARRLQRKLREFADMYKKHC